MSRPYFRELDYRVTELGPLSLRCRRHMSLDTDVYEIKLGDEFLMTSLFTASEVALADLALKRMTGGNPDVVVGGLGLGHTAHAALDHETVASLLVVEYLEPVIEWHRDGLLPLAGALTGDDRCRLVAGDFFAMAASDAGFDPAAPGRRFDAILLDIDHSPDFHLDAAQARFYEPEGLARLRAHLKPGGVFGLWSNDPPDDAFTRRLATVFDTVAAEPVTFHNPLQDRGMTQTVYLGIAGPEA